MPTAMIIQCVKIECLANTGMSKCKRHRKLSIEWRTNTNWWCHNNFWLLNVLVWETVSVYLSESLLCTKWQANIQIWSWSWCQMNRNTVASKYLTYLIWIWKIGYADFVSLLEEKKTLNVDYRMNKFCSKFYV